MYRSFHGCHVAPGRHRHCQTGSATVEVTTASDVYQVEVELFRAENRYVAIEPMELEPVRPTGRANDDKHSATAAARRQFDQAMAVLEVDRDAAHRHWEATDADPSMADAWLGRVAVGDDGLATLQELYAYGSRLHPRVQPVGSRPRRHRKSRTLFVHHGYRAAHAGLALASALIDGKRFEKAEAVLTDSALLDSWRTISGSSMSGLT